MITIPLFVLNRGIAKAILSNTFVIPTARLVSWGIAAVEPGMFGLGPIPAVKQALERAGWDIGSVERVEINEAFAAIAIVVARELGLQE